jgi:uncharacterized membrane protein (DUF485 family)
MSFGTIVVVSFIVSVLLTLTMNAILRYEKVGMEGVYLSIAAWTLGLVLWIVFQRRAQREREELEEELKRDTSSD